MGRDFVTLVWLLSTLSFALTCYYYDYFGGAAYNLKTTTSPATAGAEHYTPVDSAASAAEEVLERINRKEEIKQVLNATQLLR